jgi:glycosyltransferase involved in cell wall biosynthesis
MIVNQWVPAAHRGDAVGDNARALRDLFREEGHDADVFALTIDDDLRHEIVPWSDSAARDGDVTILHYAMPSPLTSAFATLAGGRVVSYHNVTPPSFFAPFDRDLARLTAIGRREIRSLVGRVDLAVGDSEYNRRELESMGFTPTAVMPLLLDVEGLRHEARVPAVERLLQDGLANILFVGRLAPNKKIEDHIKLAEHYKRYVDSFYRFIFVGRDDAVPAYGRALRALVSEYQMLPERFWFTGPVDRRDLAAYYRNAHAYVSLSEHEGFCVPLLEAMSMDVPVLAYGAAAVPETMGGAGLTFVPKDLELAAELLGVLVYDQDVRSAVIEGQRRRVREFAPDQVVPKVLDALASVGL